jgi:predicted DsbA family dithiol-disulfide isomerase
MRRADHLPELMKAMNEVPSPKNPLGVKCAGEAGINAQQIRELLDSEQDVAETKAEIQHATNIGVTGVPTFILRQSYALVGAQSPDVLADAIGRVAKEIAEES